MSAMHHQIQAEIPSLRRDARALTRSSAQADDLVQDCLTRAITKCHLWQEGTDLRAWLFTIMHNQHVSWVRRSIRLETVELTDETPIDHLPPSASGRLELRDLERAMAKLPPEQREVLLLIGLEGMNYETAAMVTKVLVGTVRSRVSRARDTLRRLMGAEETTGGRSPSSRAQSLCAAI